MKSQLDLNIRLLYRLKAFTRNMNAKRDRDALNKIIETTALDNDSCAQSAATSTAVPSFGALITTNLIPC
jgi:hypothetical protein